MSKQTVSFGIFGCGVMGSAIAQGLSKSYPLFLYDRNREKALQLAKELGSSCEAARNPQELLKKCKLFFCAVKPSQFDLCASQLAPHLVGDHLLLSVMAGITVSTLEKKAAPASILRLMPNLAVGCGSGIIAAAKKTNMTLSEQQKIEQLLAPLGAVVWFDEEKMDAVTALTGSGPAFVCVVVEAIVEAAISMGIKKEQALPLALQMISGTEKVLTAEKVHPAELRWRICSPGGTTIAGIEKMEQYGVRHGIMAAFLAAYEKAKKTGS